MALIFLSLISLGDVGATYDARAQGTVIEVKETGSSENESQIYQYDYSFITASGASMSGSSYASGNYELAAGDTVAIDYVQNDPVYSSISGMRNGTFPPWVALVVLIFPLTGIIMSVVSFRRGKKHLYLATNGLMTYGKVTGMEPTNVKINNQTVYKVFFEFNAPESGLQSAFVKTHKPMKLRDEETERLVYDPNNPSQAVLVDALPKGLRTFFEKLETGF